MNVMICPLDSLISSSTAFRRSSNSPRYFAPATMEPRSSEISVLPLSDSGTSPATMRRARPSTMAVLPTPGSPMSTGLFFVRRESTCTTRRISESRPITGSILPSRARAVRSVEYFCSAWNWSSGLSEVTFLPPRTEGNASFRASNVAPRLCSNSAASSLPLAMPARRTSAETYSSPSSPARSCAVLSAVCRSRLMPGLAMPWPSALG